MSHKLNHSKKVIKMKYTVINQSKGTHLNKGFKFTDENVQWRKDGAGLVNIDGAGLWIHKDEVLAEFRPLSEIASDIRKEWSKAKNGVNFAAKPYLSAMMGLNSINDNYGFDDGRSIVNYFLCNASQFRGERAKELKAELKALLKG